MDFHHGVFKENQLRLMLINGVVELIFQPPYIPKFNSCEVCSRSMWICHLRINFCTASRVRPNAELLCRKFIL